MNYLNDVLHPHTCSFLKSGKTCYAKILLGLFLLLSFNSFGQQQKVGVVLSGGGATALSHVGFLRALEENNVPIDYITGSSMGAVVGALYACGYSVDEIELMVLSDVFQQMANGSFNKSLNYYFKDPIADASMVNLKYAHGAFTSTSLPTNLIDPGLLDFKFMEIFSAPSAAAKLDFNNLYIPFRCVASDIVDKESVVFSRGHLAQAVRASSTYPFYLPPIAVGGHLLFDGGLYNNFPVDVLYDAFSPDVIIGCNVSEIEASPREDDFLSQLKSMILYRNHLEYVCEEMVVVSPELKIPTFDFDNLDVAISSGYEATMKRMPAIVGMLSSRESMSERSQKRFEFRERFVPIVIDEIHISGLDVAQRSYVKKLFRKKGIVGIEELEPDYFRILADDKIKSIYPLAYYKADSGYYHLDLNIHKERDVQFDFGGNISSRPVSMGYVGAKYNLFGTTPSTFSANAYFGKFYGSGHVDLKIDLPSSLPFSLQPGFTYNRWDYFKGFATFYQEVRPAFTVINEKFGGVRLVFPAGNKGRFTFDADYGELKMDYYQQSEFLAADTADRTTFEGFFLGYEYDRNTLDRKQFASSGNRVKLKFKIQDGHEITTPGNTSFSKDTTHFQHFWLSAKLSATHYFFEKTRFHLGLYGELYLSDQPFFSNYNATIIAAPAFSPTNESNTFFMPQFRAHNYYALGLINVINLRKNIDLRLEAYAFSPAQSIAKDLENKAVYKTEFDPRYLCSFSLIYHTIVGPASVSWSYYDRSETPSVFSLNFGYILFNRSIRD